MNPVAHFMIGGTLACWAMIYLIEYPCFKAGTHRRRMSPRITIVTILLIASLAAFPQVTRYIGDKKLDAGPLLNLFVFHDILELAGQRFRLGEGLVDPPVILTTITLGIGLLVMISLRSDRSTGWQILLRDAIYVSLIIGALVMTRWVVSSHSYIYYPKTSVYVHGLPLLVVEDTVFTDIQWLDNGGFIGTPVVGELRDKAIAVRDTYLAVNSTSWISLPDSVGIFLNGKRPLTPSLEYSSLESMIDELESNPGLATQEELRPIIDGATLPQNNLPSTLVVGIPLATLGLAAKMMLNHL